MWGLDPWTGPLREAYARHFYRLVIQADGARSPFPDGWFANAIRNYVLEHIPHLDDMIVEVARVLKPGGLFVFCVPNDRFTTSLFGTTIFRKLDLKSASEVYSRFFNRIARYAHCDSQAVWKQPLQKLRLYIEKCWDYFPPRSLFVLETRHFLGLPAFFTRKLTGRRILWKNWVNFWLPWDVKHRHVTHPISDQGTCSFYIIRKKA